MITGAQLRDAFISAANNLSNHRESVDALNIFPVPDGDTGTNMSRTLNSALPMLMQIDDSATASEVADKAASAFLRGARGNSGAITSLIFRGFADGLKGCESANGVVIATALELARENAYKSVMKPTEGTILTVIRFAADYARDSIGVGVHTLDVFKAAFDGSKKALKRTPELLSILKRAKVVDAGGQGLVYILEGMYSVFNGEGIIERSDAEAENTGAVTAVAAESFDSDYPYCSEFIVNKANDCPSIEKLKNYFAKVGDCALVIDDGDIIKIHVHSACPGDILNHVMKYGELAEVKIENMRIQHKNASWVDETPADVPQLAEPEKQFGFVAIGAGEGIEALFGDLGADKIVSGGQTMNPSTEDILSAVNATPSETVFVLPNNKNIILTAHQTESLTEKKVVVIETKSIPAGVCAMLSFDPDASEEDNISAMNEAFKNVQTASITFAARDSDLTGVDIHEGDILGLENGKVALVDSDPNEAALRCIKHLANRKTVLVTIYYGEGITEDAAERLAAAVSAKLGDDVEVSTVYGGQPIYYYIIAVE